MYIIYLLTVEHVVGLTGMTYGVSNIVSCQQLCGIALGLFVVLVKHRYLAL